MKRIIFSFLVLFSFSLIYYTVNKAPIRPKSNFNYFIAGNFFDSEKSLEYSLPELLKVIRVLNTNNNVFVSFLENGSTDRTKEILSDFQLSLQVPNKIVICNQSSTVSWKLNKILGREYIAKLFKERAGIRYQRMAVLRNLALLPLYSYEFKNDYPIKVVFLNDVYFEADQLMELIFTNDGKYDMVCALDFYYQFYDVLVARDIDGYWFSGYYPYTRHKDSQDSLRKNQPFKVKSCWNGITVFNSEPLLTKNLTFRGRKFSNSSCECVQSECLLFCADLIKNKYEAIYINPNIKVSYEWKYYILHYYFSFFINFIHQSWFDFRTPPEVQSNQIGCSMPPYWEPEIPRTYMSLSSPTCTLNVSDFEIYNKHQSWLIYEDQVYNSYLQEFTQTCS